MCIRDRLIFSTAWTLPDIPLKKPFEISNLVVRFSTFNNGSTDFIDDMILKRIMDKFLQFQIRETFQENLFPSLNQSGVQH